MIAPFGARVPPGTHPSTSVGGQRALQRAPPLAVPAGEASVLPRLSATRSSPSACAAGGASAQPRFSAARPSAAAPSCAVTRRARVSNPTRDRNKVLRWYPGRGRLMASPTSPGMFYTTKVRASIAWWLQPAQHTPLKVLQYLQHGVKIEFDRPMKPLNLAPRLITEPCDIAFALKDLAKGRASGAYVDLAAGGASFLSRSRVHTVASGKQRMVHALCGLNEVTTKRPCRYELLRDLPSVLRPNDWMLSVDAEAAFWSVPIHRTSRKFMSSHYALPAFYHVHGQPIFVPLQAGGYWAPTGQASAALPWPTARLPPPSPSSPPAYIQVIELSHAVTPFGWTASPRIWVAVFRVVVAALRRAGLRILVFVDDLLIALATRSAALRAKVIIEATFVASGLTRAPDKGQFEPTQTLKDHLGFQICSKGMGLMTVPERRCYHLRNMSRTLLCQSARGKRRVPSAELRQFTGTAVSCMDAVPQARLRLRSLFDAQEEWAFTSTLSRASLRDLQWWSTFSTAHPGNGKLIWPPPPTRAMYTDASGRTGFGSVLDVPNEARRTHGSFWTSDELQDIICVKELKAVKLGLLEHAPALQGHTVLLYQDNMAVVGCLKNLTSTSPAMMVELREVLSILDQFQIRFEIVYIRSHLNPADAPSRLCSADLWSLSPKMQRQLLARAEAVLQSSVDMDPFACRVSKVAPIYATPLHDPSAAGLDGLLLNWATHTTWLNPPWDLLEQVIDKIKLHGGRGVLIYPLWHLQRWFEDVSSLPGVHLKLPPPRFSVVAHHPGRVDPLCNHAVQLRAVVFDVPCSTAVQDPLVGSRSVWRPLRSEPRSWSKWSHPATRSWSTTQP